VVRQADGADRAEDGAAHRQCDEEHSRPALAEEGGQEGGDRLGQQDPGGTASEQADQTTLGPYI